MQRLSAQAAGNSDLRSERAPFPHMRCCLSLPLLPPSTLSPTLPTLLLQPSRGGLQTSCRALAAPPALAAAVPGWQIQPAHQTPLGWGGRPAPRAPLPQLPRWSPLLMQPQTAWWPCRWMMQQTSSSSSSSSSSSRRLGSWVLRRCRRVHPLRLSSSSSSSNRSNRSSSQQPGSKPLRRLRGAAVQRQAAAAAARAERLEWVLVWAARQQVQHPARRPAPSCHLAQRCSACPWHQRPPQASTPSLRWIWCGGACSWGCGCAAVRWYGAVHACCCEMGVTARRCHHAAFSLAAWSSCASAMQSCSAAAAPLHALLPCKQYCERL